MWTVNLPVGINVALQVQLPIRSTTHMVSEWVREGMIEGWRESIRWPSSKIPTKFYLARDECVVYKTISLSIGYG